ncbi:MAG: LysM peptidoglycan-binding domain-containing protein [Pseudomonadales bacterium]|nr:LysM peptidoglycan-binding domain-containing protein [Pseudomonadales bacterium]
MIKPNKTFTSLNLYKQFSIIVFILGSISACQTVLLPSDQDLSEPTTMLNSENPVNLSKLVSEEIVIAAAMPITKDGRDDLVERENDPLPLEPPKTEITPEEISDLWRRMRKGFVLDHHLDNKRVKAELNWYLRHPDYLDRVATRATRYLFHIVQEVESRQLPMELALLPIVESAFDPFAYSHGRASGLWQFIPSTGKLYGLKIDYWYDGRRDVVRATNAALNYLVASHKSLNQDWLLALAAYNTGGGNVRHSMRKNTKAGKPTDFFSLGLFRETRAYVPRLLAISAIVSNPEKYNITLKPIANEAYFEVVDIGSQIDLSKAARLANTSIEELYLLNPAFNKWSTHPEGPHSLLIPVEHAEGFRQDLENLPVEQRLSWKHHIIKNGESLGVIAQRYHTTTNSIRNANNIKGNLIVAGQSLLIPVATHSSDQYQLSDAQRLKSNQASVQKKTGAPPTKYKIRSGDNLWDLSRKFGVSVRALAKWNGMAPTDLLSVDKQLLIFTTPQNVALLENAHINNSFANKNVIRKVNYRVRQGESLALIANKFNLSINKIRKWNKKVSSKRYIQPGDRITLYVDVTQTE